MKRICFLFNHFQFQDGVCRSAIAMANHLAKRDDVEITLMSIYKFDNETLQYLNHNVKAKGIFKVYFRGITKLVRIVPTHILYNHYIKGKFDLEIAFQFGASYRIINSIPKSDRITRIGWIHGYDMSYKPYYLKMDQMVCVSKEGAKRAYYDLDNKVPVTFCYNPIDDENVVQSGFDTIPIKHNDNGLQFVTVGRLSPEKGFDRLIRIFGNLKKEKYSFSLWIIGDGPEKSKLESLISENKLGDSVRLLGAQRNPHAYTSKTDVFICSSCSEGYSTACTEALMLGIPVITTRVGGAQEIISDSECGILTEIDDESLYKGIKTVLENPSIIKDWQNTLKRTKVRFSANQRLGQLFKILHLD